jgi:hypothetical protein
MKLSELAGKLIGDYCIHPDFPEWDSIKDLARAYLRLLDLVDNELNTWKHTDCGCDLCRYREEEEADDDTDR